MLEVKLSELLNKLYALEKKDIKDYTHDDNVFIYQCINNKEDIVNKTAENTLSNSMKNYLYNKAKDMVLSRKTIKHLNTQAIEDIMSAGFLMVSQRLKFYDPYKQTQIHTYMTDWISDAMEEELDYQIKGTRLKEHDRRILKWMRAVDPFLKEAGIKDPTVQDYVNRAIEDGKGKDKYNISVISRILDYKRFNEYGITSFEGLEEEGGPVPYRQDISGQVISDMMCEENYEIIKKLGYHDRIAILCKIEAEDYVPEEYDEETGKKIPVSNNPNKRNKIKKDYMYQLFLEKTGMTPREHSKKEFERLLADAINEFKRRKFEKPLPIRSVTSIDNSLSLDDSYDVFFEMGEELASNTEKSEENKIDVILKEEFNKRYSQKSVIFTYENNMTLPETSKARAQDSTTVTDLINI